MVVIGPDIWGVHGWKFIHFVTLAYPNSPTEEDKIHYKTFLESLQYVLPCSICSNNFKKNLLTYPLDDIALKDKVSLTKWGIDMHNEVNKETGKRVLSYDEALELITNNFPNKSNESNLQQTNIQVNEKILDSPKKKSKNVEFNSNSRDNRDNKDNKDTGSSQFITFTVLLIILISLISIAVVYKKN